MAWFTGAPVRVCSEDPEDVDTGGQLHTHRLPNSPSMHQIVSCFLMLEVLGLHAATPRLATWWTPDDERQGEAISREARQGRRYLIALGCAASLRSKRWPRELYLEVIRSVRRSHDASFLALGGADVAETCRWLVRQEPQAIMYPGERLHLGATWSSIAHCDLYLGNDTGIMHMAAASRLPVVLVLSEAGVRDKQADSSVKGPFDTLSRIVHPPVSGSGGDDTNSMFAPVDGVVAATLELLGKRIPTAQQP